MDWNAFIPTALFVLHWGATCLVAVRVVSKRRSQGVSLAWLAVLAWIPIAGIVLYILVGEAWLTRRRTGRIQATLERLLPRLESLRAYAPRQADPSKDADIERYNTIALTTTKIPALNANRIDIIDGADDFFPAFIDAIDRAESSIDLLFYIYSPGARVDEVTDALARASQRGVAVRVLADAVGSRPLFKHKHSMRTLEQAGVRVRRALPVRFPRQLFARVDLRNHRKLAVIDHRAAYTGSMNLADPDIFKASAKVGPWVDIMSRIEGPAVHALSAIFEIDWHAEHDHESPDPNTPDRPETPGSATLQIVNSGPGDNPDAFRRILLQAIYDAREEIVISTPYFVPDDALLTAITTADIRGVDVKLIVPRRVDSLLVRHASESYFDDLVHAGVEIYRYTPGLLHAKTITADSRLALIGSANLDRRSLWINFELSVIAHDQPTAQRVRAVQQHYIDESEQLCKETWSQGNLIQRIADNAAQLLAPIL